MNYIYVSGSLAFDFLMQTNLSLRGMSFPEDGIATHSILANGLFKNDGGTAGNVAHSLSLLSLPVKIITSVGEDATQYLQRLSLKKIDVSSVKVVQDSMTAYASALTDSVGNQIFFFCPGAMDIPSQLPEMKAQWAIVSPGNHADMRAFPAAYRRSKTQYIYDPGQMIHSLNPDSLLDGMTGAHTLIMNEFEWGEFSRKMSMNIEEALVRSETIIITRGERGASIYARENEFSVSAIETHSVDTMGAGDAFRAGHLYGLMQSTGLDISASLGCTLASFCVEKRGTQTHNPTIKEIADRFEHAYKKPFPLYTSQ